MCALSPDSFVPYSCAVTACFEICRLSLSDEGKKEGERVRFDCYHTSNTIILIFY